MRPNSSSLARRSPRMKMSQISLSTPR
ncbi:hypothetical protein IHE44_0008609 [Lamprotornis superbus]|uniref:Uncharacterized protein n=1 Tax=Lamprotornis superbus TaxID=245042 RepID=A0A835NLX2_9PASS|nr:hypothetical protein IHE44_0008609 [Lamprotornis superbus]